MVLRGPWRVVVGILCLMLGFFVWGEAYVGKGRRDLTPREARWRRWQGRLGWILIAGGIALMLTLEGGP